MAWHYNFKSRQGRSQNFCLKRGFDLFLPFPFSLHFSFFISLLFFFCLLFLLSFPFLVLEVGLLKCSQRIWGNAEFPSGVWGSAPAEIECSAFRDGHGSGRPAGRVGSGRVGSRVSIKANLAGRVKISEMRYFVLYRRS